MILHLCLVFLKWGSGKRKNILLSWKTQYSPFNCCRCLHATLDLHLLVMSSPKCGPHYIFWLFFMLHWLQNWNSPLCFSSFLSPQCLSLTSAGSTDIKLADKAKTAPAPLFMSYNNIRYRQRDVGYITGGAAAVSSGQMEDGKPLHIQLFLDYMTYVNEANRGTQFMNEPTRAPRSAKLFPKSASRGALTRANGSWIILNDQKCHT